MTSSIIPFDEKIKKLDVESQILVTKEMPKAPLREGASTTFPNWKKTTFVKNPDAHFNLQISNNQRNVDSFELEVGLA